ncbi:hypothetical protein Gotur_026737 [Gossypium turneri]
MAKFWWQKRYGRKGIHWCEWSHMCRLKEEKGMAKYFPNTDFVNAHLGNMEKHLGYDGRVTRGALLEDLIDVNNMAWKEELIVNTFAEWTPPRSSVFLWRRRPMTIYLYGVRGPSGCAIKINFDGAYNGRNFRSAFDIVVRNVEWQILFSCLKIHDEVSSVFSTEALACHRAVQTSFEMGWLEVTIEGDSLAIIKKDGNEVDKRTRLKCFIAMEEKRESGKTTDWWEYVSPHIVHVSQFVHFVDIAHRIQTKILTSCNYMSAWITKCVNLPQSQVLFLRCTQYYPPAIPWFDLSSAHIIGRRRMIVSTDRKRLPYRSIVASILGPRSTMTQISGWGQTCLLNLERKKSQSSPDSPSIIANAIGRIFPSPSYATTSNSRWMLEHLASAEQVIVVAHRTRFKVYYAT